MATLPIVWMAGARYSPEVWHALAKVEARERLGDGKTFAAECPECGARTLHSADGLRAFMENHAKHARAVAERRAAEAGR